MGDYVQGKRPEPGRHSVETRVEIIKERESSKDNKLDDDSIKAIANAVISAIGDKRSVNNSAISNDDFNDSESLSKLADAMIVQRGNSRSNFEDLGSIKTTKREGDGVNKTIDILSDLDN